MSRPNINFLAEMSESSDDSAPKGSSAEMGSSTYTSASTRKKSTYLSVIRFLRAHGYDETLLNRFIEEAGLPPNFGSTAPESSDNRDPKDSSAEMGSAAEETVDDGQRKHASLEGTPPKETLSEALGVKRPPSPKPQHPTLTYHIGNMFMAPNKTVLIHACNTEGTWGSGIARCFSHKYPKAYKIYRNHCSDKKPSTGSCLLIPPVDKKSRTGRYRKHWIGCLFNSAGYGKTKDNEEAILQNTENAMRALLTEIQKKTMEGGLISGLRMCKVNSGQFGVEWEKTKKVLEGLEVDVSGPVEIEVWSRGTDSSSKKEG